MRALSAALGALRRHWAVVLFTFLVQFSVAGLAALGVYLSTVSLVGSSALFDRAVAGDLPALVMCMTQERGLILFPLVIAALALLAYAAISWFLAAGVIGMIGSRGGTSEFARWGAARFFSFARLAVWSLVGWTIVLIAAGIGLNNVGDAITEALTMGELVSVLAWRLAPALVFLWIFFTWSDIARIHLVAAERASAWRSIGRAARTLFRRPVVLAITLAGHLIAGLILFLSLRLLGVGGGLLFFALRQLFLAARHATHIGVIAAEIDRLQLEPAPLD